MLIGNFVYRLNHRMINENDLDEIDSQPIQTNHRRRKRNHSFKRKKSSYHQQKQ